MKNFEQSYCERHHCTSAQFRRRVFWSTLYPHAVLLAPVFLLTGLFDADRELIAACGRARNLRELTAELQEHRFHATKHWLRHRLAVRVSRARLLQFAQRYLASSGVAAASVK